MYLSRGLSSCCSCSCSIEVLEIATLNSNGEIKTGNGGSSTGLEPGTIISGLGFEPPRVSSRHRSNLEDPPSSNPPPPPTSFAQADAGGISFTRQALLFIKTATSQSCRATLPLPTYEFMPVRQTRELFLGLEAWDNPEPIKVCHASGRCFHHQFRFASHPSRPSHEMGPCARLLSLHHLQSRPARPAYTW